MFEINQEVKNIGSGTNANKKGIITNIVEQAGGQFLFVTYEDGSTGKGEARHYQAVAPTTADVTVSSRQMRDFDPVNPIMSFELAEIIKLAGQTLKTRYPNITLESVVLTDAFNNETPDIEDFTVGFSVEEVSCEATN